MNHLFLLVNKVGRDLMAAILEICLQNRNNYHNYRHYHNYHNYRHPCRTEKLSQRLKLIVKTITTFDVGADLKKKLHWFSQKSKKKF